MHCCLFYFNKCNNGDKLDELEYRRSNAGNAGNHTIIVIKPAHARTQCKVQLCNVYIAYYFPYLKIAKLNREWSNNKL